MNHIPTDKLLAKPDQTLFEHTNKVYHIWETIYERYQHIIESKVGADFWQKSLISVIFHDIGKIVDSFQEMIHAIKEHKYFDYENNFRHELFSGIVVACLLKNDILPSVAVFSHHKNLNDELFDSQKCKEFSFDINHLKDFYHNYEKVLSKYGFRFEISTLEKLKDLNSKNCYEFFNKRIFWHRRETITQLNRIEYIFYKGILQVCDWLASSGKSIRDDLLIEKEELRKKVQDKITNETKKKTSVKFSNLQILCSESKNDCLVIAPTGSGKTEASLLWAGKKEGRILYLLPTRVTSNAIFERMESYFHSENVGLVHTGAYSYHKEIDDNYDYSQYLLEKTFNKPLTVATLDQLLTCGFNIGFWEIKEFNCLNARIIIDEIHSYDFYTLGLIISTIRHLKELNAKFFIMSATIPKFLKELIKKELPSIKISENKSLMKSSRNRFFIYDTDVDCIENKIRDEVENKKKVLIVVNTVNEAIRLYEKYKEYNPVCYHSRFILKDRQQKEKEIKDISDGESGKLVITTQVVEVSLDIDFDVLFTENAPADSTIQRAGRVNRRWNKKNTKVIIFRHTEEAEFYGKNILEKSFSEFQKYNRSKINESKFIQIVEEVYKDVKVEENQDYLEGLKLYKEIQEHYHFIQDVSDQDEKTYTRKIKNVKLPIVPMKFLEYLSDKDKTYISNYVVDIPIWATKQIEKCKEKGFVFCNVDYNYERGVKLLTPKTDYSKYVF